MAIDYVNTLGGGAGFNTKEIVSALVEAERAPKQSRIESKIESSEAEISALSEALSSLKQVETAALALNDKADFNTYLVSNSQPTALTVSANTNASEGSHSITVSSVAREQRTNVTPDGATEFTSTSQLLNSGSAFDIVIAIGDSSPVSHTISVTTTTPTGIVDAINAAGIDVSANLIDKGVNGSEYVIQLVGESGTDNQFTFTPSVNSVLVSDTPSGSTAANATLTVNGLAFSRSSNTINDIITGVTLNLNSVTSGAAAMTIGQDTTVVESNIRGLVSAFNSAKTAIGDLTSRELEGALAGDSIFRQIMRSVTNIFTGLSSTPGSNITRLSDLGISINRSGLLEISDTKLSEALSADFQEVRKIFSADTNQQSNIGVENRGVSGDLYKLVSDLEGSSGYFTTQTALLNANIDEYNFDLQDLERKMESLKARYDKQFAAMNSLVSELNNTRDNLISTFENLPFTNRD